MMEKTLKLKRGFTLLEVLISVALFSLISIATAKQIGLIRNTKIAAFDELDMYNGIRATFSILKSDLNQAFHVRVDDLGDDIKDALVKNEKVPHTLFDGRKNEIVFTSLSHRNFYQGRRESEQTEISYFLQQRKGLKAPSLMKREADKIDGDLYKGGNVVTILDNVTSLEFTYWDDKTAKWQDAWNSDAGNFRDRFPMAVRMKIGVINAKNKELKLETVYKVAFPNNDPQLVKF